MALLVPVTSFALDPDRDLAQYNVNEWGVDQQLPQITVTALAQDKLGYIWVGTNNGLARFNGRKFTNYVKSNTSGLQSSIIKDLLMDKRGFLWILTDSGLTKYFQGNFTSVTRNSNSSIKRHSLVEFNDQIIFSTYEGLKLFSNEKLVDYLIYEESYALEANGTSLLVGGRGVFHRLYNNQSESIKLPTGYEKAVINDIEVSDDGIWLASSQGLLLYSEEIFIELSKKFPLANEPTNALYLDEHGVLWAATDVASYRIKNGEHHHSEEKPSYPRVSTYMLDNDGTLWLGTSDRGLFQLWDSWSVRYSEYYGIKESLIWSLAGNTLDQLIVGSDSGVYKYENERFTPFISKQSLPNPSAYTLFIDLDQSVWVGTKGGVAHFSKLGEPIIEDTERMRGLQINAIFRDSHAHLWFLTKQGVYRLKNGKLEQIGEETELKRASYRAIYEYLDKIYLGTQSGLLIYDGKDLIRAKDNRLNTFISVLAEYKGSIIAGTYSEGFYVSQGDSWVNINKDNGLIFNDSFSINLVNQYFWISGFDGVYRLSAQSLINFAKGKQKEVSAEAVLNDSGYVAGSQKAYCCNGAGHAKSTIIDENIWLPTRKGVLKLEPNKVTKNEMEVRTIIEKLKTSESAIDLSHQNANLSKHGKFSFEDKDISFEFIGLTSFDEGLVNYRYRLIGYSNDWVESGEKRIASYTNLSAGKYTFEVIARNNSGLWTKEPTQFRFTISPLYYETLLFKIFMLVSLLFILYAIYRFINFQNQRKVDLLESTIEKKTKALLISNDQLAEANKRLSVYSYTDPLTGAFNRRYLVKQIASDIAHYVRQSDENHKDQDIVFLMADIDFFKDINDKFGHASGDKILRHLVVLIQENIRDGDYLVRWGGEEFLIVLRPDHVIDIEEMCTRLLRKVSVHPFKGVNNDSIDLTLSLGFCFYPLARKRVDLWSWKNAVEVADRALYQAKNNGRNQWVGFQLLPYALENFNTENQLEEKCNEIGDQYFQRFNGNV